MFRTEAEDQTEKRKKQLASSQKQMKKIVHFTQLCFQPMWFIKRETMKGGRLPMADTSMTTTKLKQINRRRVYQLIYEEGGISKQAIATRL